MKNTLVKLTTIALLGTVTLGISNITHADEIVISNSSIVQPDSISRSNVWIKSHAPYVYYQEQAYGTLYRGYLGLDTKMPNGWGIYKGRLYKLGLPYPIPTKLNFKQGEYHNYDK